MRYRNLLLAAALTLAPALAQTTGVIGTNDLTVNGLGSSTTSCSPLCFPNGGLTLNLAVSAPPGSIAIALFNFCPCVTCSLPGPTNACVPAIPLTACGPSNQSLDIDMTAACGITFSGVMVPNTAGVTSLQVNIPTIPGPPCTNAILTVQAAVISPCGLGLFGVTGPFVMTQAHQISF